MKTAVVYVHPIKMAPGYDPAVEQVSGTYDECAKRFVDTYRKFPGGAKHKLVVVFTGDWPNGEQISMYEGVEFMPLLYTGTGWCTGAHQYAARNMGQCHFAVFSSNRTYFVKPGWLERLVSERKKHGAGMYGTMANCQKGQHLRTNFYGIDPEHIGCRYEFNSRDDTWRFEHGDWSVSRFYRDAGMQSRLVTWDGSYGPDDWMKPANCFRVGDQSNLIVRDRHTLIFDNETEAHRDHLTRVTTGVTCD